MSEAGDVLAVLDRLSKSRVLVIGDIMLDRFVYGQVSRVSPEGPIPVLRVMSEKTMLGGAGNVLRNLCSLGARATLIGVVGEDEPGAQIYTLLGAEKNAVPRLVHQAGRPTSVKVRFVAQNQQLVRADTEDDSPLADSTVKSLMQRFEMSIQDCDVVILSDYAKGVLSGDVTAELISKCRALDKKVIVDPKGLDYTRYAGASLITPNRAEMVQACRMEPAPEIYDDAAIAEGARLLRHKAQVDAVLVTRSEAGMTLVDSEDHETHLRTTAREVADVSGAGDTVAATLAAAIGAGADARIAARLANIAAGIAVGKRGTAVVFPAEIALALQSGSRSISDSKVVPAQIARVIVDGWKERGLKVGFTNGCFDLIHPGHISLLAQARASADKLVVGLNADESVQRLKGPTRPVQSEAARATVLASMENVDLVVVFSDDTPLKLIETIRPDVLIKGADYKIDQVVGGDLVRAWGGEVKLAQLEEGHSTTNTIKRINA